MLFLPAFNLTIVYKGMKKWHVFDPVGLLVQLTLWGLIFALPLVMALAEASLEELLHRIS